MVRIHKQIQQHPKKKERRFCHRSHVCLRTECLVSAVLVGLLAMFVTWGSSSIVSAGYDLVQARGCLRNLENQNELLRLEMAQLKAPQRVQNIAVSQLGMINPPTVYIAANGVVPGMPVKEETVTVQRNSLFGDSRAEAHTIQQ